MSDRLYFVYGSNMNQAQMAQRCPVASLMSTGLLVNNYKDKIDGRGFATILVQEDRWVWGLAWQLTTTIGKK